jgi:hypothetical protein
MSDTLPEFSGAAEPRSAANELKQTAKDATAAVANEVREVVAHGTARAREEATARTEDAKQGLAREMSATAEALDATSRDLEEHSLQRGLLSEASKGLASMSEALHGRSIEELISDVAEFGRRNPAAFLGGATLAGFALARLAIASAPAGGTPRDENARPQMQAGAADDPQRAGAWPQMQPAGVDRQGPGAWSQTRPEAQEPIDRPPTRPFEEEPRNG